MSSLEYIRRFLSHRFFARAEEPVGPWQVIAWWEARRLPYNMLVGFAGLMTGFVCITSGLVAERLVGVPIGLPDPPLFALVAVAAYGIMANVCYTGGWIAEVIVNKVWAQKGRDFGPIAFTLGVFFSVGVTLLPGLVVAIWTSVYILLYCCRAGS